MPENKPSAPAAAQPAPARRGDPMQDLDDVTVLFTTPPELIRQTAARDERDEDVTAFYALPRSNWDSGDDEATLAIQLSSALPSLKPLQPASSVRPLVTPPVAPASSVEIGDAELGAILGPRRAARWLALGAALTFVLLLLVVARLAP